MSSIGINGLSYQYPSLIDRKYFLEFGFVWNGRLVMNSYRAATPNQTK